MKKALDCSMYSHKIPVPAMIESSSCSFDCDASSRFRKTFGQLALFGFLPTRGWDGHQAKGLAKNIREILAKDCDEIKKRK